MCRWPRCRLLRMALAFGANAECTIPSKFTGSFFESGSVKSGAVCPTCGAPCDAGGLPRCKKTPKQKNTVNANASTANTLPNIFPRYASGRRDARAMPTAIMISPRAMSGQIHPRKIAQRWEADEVQRVAGDPRQHQHETQPDGLNSNFVSSSRTSGKRAATLRFFGAGSSRESAILMRLKSTGRVPNLSGLPENARKCLVTENTDRPRSHTENHLVNSPRTR